MCRTNTPGRSSCVLLVVCLLAAGLSALAQAQRPDWRRIGNSALDLSVAGVATGPVDRVWYSDDGGRLFARTSSGAVFVTNDFEEWAPVATDGLVIPASFELNAAKRPERRMKIRGQRPSSATMYGIGRFAYRTEDGGASWTNLTAHRNTSILGEGLSDLAVSPRNFDDVTIAAATGVWRSVDGGLSWSGLNQGLPNLRLERLIAAPSNTRGVRITVADQAFEWAPGEKQAWRPTSAPELDREEDLKRILATRIGERITAIAQAGDYQYAGSASGRIWVSQDRGTNWTVGPDQYASPVAAIFVDARDPQFALAALGERSPLLLQVARNQRVFKTTNGGRFWDDLTSNLPDAAVNGVTADRGTGSIYVATDRGVFMTMTDLIGGGAATTWTALAAGLPGLRSVDVRLDAAANQLFVAVDGYGVYAAPAPHRFKAPRLLSAADLSERPAAPGTLLTVLGANVQSARVGTLPYPVLAASEGKSEIQVPFEATGTSLSLALEASTGTLNLGIPLQSASPAILIDQEGAPVALNADTGVMLDAMTPARSNSRIQLLATGLGRVKPDWPTGMPAPQLDSPKVVASVRAYLDRSPVEVTRATLAPGYVGFYLIEIDLPKLVNYGPAELYLEVDGQPSNRVRVYIEP